MDESLEGVYDAGSSGVVLSLWRRIRVNSLRMALLIVVRHQTPM